MLRSIHPCSPRASSGGVWLAERGRRRLRLCLARTVPGALGSPSAPLRGLPSVAGRVRMNGGETCRDHVRDIPPVRPRKYGPAGTNRRGGAPEGDALSVIERACRNGRKIKCAFPALRLPRSGSQKTRAKSFFGRRRPGRQRQAGLKIRGRARAKPRRRVRYQKGEAR